MHPPQGNNFYAEQLKKIKRQPKEPEYNFRWAILGIPLTIIIFAYVIKHIEPSFSFNDILDYFGIAHKAKYENLVSLAVVCLSLIVIAKLFRSKRG